MCHISISADSDQDSIEVLGHDNVPDEEGNVMSWTVPGLEDCSVALGQLRTQGSEINGIKIKHDFLG